MLGTFETFVAYTSEHQIVPKILMNLIAFLSRVL